LSTINNISQLSQTHEIQNTSSVPQKLKPKQSDFLQKFEKIKSDEVRTKLEGIFEKIVEKSDHLKNNLYLKDVLEYKKLVREFMGIAVENSHTYSQQNFLDRRGRHRVYSVVKQVDRELDAITREFITNHVDHSKVLKSIDAIRGLLVDIMM